MSSLLNPLKALFAWPPLRYRLMFSDSFNLHPDETAFKHVLEFAAHTESGGDYLEFGVWKGRSFARMYHLSRYLQKSRPALASMRFYAFDSFEGLPPPKGIDRATQEFHEGQYAASEAEFRENMAKAGVDLARVTTIKGWYDQVLNEETRKKLPLKKAAVILIDADLYESTVPVLDFITPYLVDGTVILFDDWFCFRGSPDRGEQRAFREWLLRNPHVTVSEYRRYNWKSNSFIVHIAP